MEVPKHYSCDVPQYKCICNAQWTRSFDADNGGRSFAENAKVNESLLLMKFYSSSASVLSQLLSCSDGSELNVPFEVSDQEREVILNQRSTFILGRSGTGKTTVLVMKMLQKEQHFNMASEGLVVNDAKMSCSPYSECGTRANPLCQLFVTVNPKLCFTVNKQINNLRRSGTS